MKLINENELKQINGGFFPILARLIGVPAINMIYYQYRRRRDNAEITPKGLAIAAGAGMAGSAIGVAGSLAAGGGIVGNAVWMPSSIAISTSGGLIAKEK